MEQNNKTSGEDNKELNLNEIRITLQKDPQTVTPSDVESGEDHGLATVTVRLPEKYKDYQVVGVSHKVRNDKFKDFYGNEDEIGAWDWPLFSWDMRSAIERDFKDLLNISLINQKQNESMFKLLSSTMRQHLEQGHEHSKNIRKAKKNNACSISAMLEEN